MGDSAVTEASIFQRRFDEALTRLTADDAPARWLVAFSGGLDSTLLLDAVRCSAIEAPVTVVHIDHGLHDDSALWSAHCAAHADALGIDYVAREVSIDQDSGESLEAVAREARYAVFAELLAPGDALLTAHHADDQLETILLRLLRGTGVRGLAAIRERAMLGVGLLLRPLLDFTRVEIVEQARRRGLDWLEDPSNRDLRFDRNFLRQRCLPNLLERWPRAGPVASRLARQMAEAEAVLAESAALDLAAVDDPECISLALFADLSPARRNNALRFAVQLAGLSTPSAAQLAELGRILEVREDAEAAVTWPGAEARLYRQHLYLMPAATDTELVDGKVTATKSCRVGDGALKLVEAPDYGIPDQWAQEGLSVVFRQGGERFQPHRSDCHKTLKHWFQEQGVVPWMRNSVPLLYHGDELVAVGDLALADGLPRSPDDGPFWRPQWSGHARLR